MLSFAGAERGPKLFAEYRERHPDSTPASLRERFLSDAIYVVPAWRTAMAHVEAGGKAFFYEFAWKPPFEGGRLGAAHGFDEPFLWGVADPARIPFVQGAEEEAKTLAESMSPRLVEFIRSADPGWQSTTETEPSFRVFGGPQSV